MTYAEFRDWVRFRETHGPLDPFRRFDYGIALLASVVNRSAGGKAEPSDFLPSYGPQEATPEDVIAMMMGAKR